MSKPMMESATEMIEMTEIKNSLDEAYGLSKTSVARSCSSNFYSKEKKFSSKSFHGTTRTDVTHQPSGINAVCWGRSRTSQR
jgi:hypothetical protein